MIPFAVQDSVRLAKVGVKGARQRTIAELGWAHRWGGDVLWKQGQIYCYLHHSKTWTSPYKKLLKYIFPKKYLFLILLFSLDEHFLLGLLFVLEDEGVPLGRRAVRGGDVAINLKITALINHVG